MAKVSTPRDRWVVEGLQALAEGGPEAVRVEVLAKRLGVTKGGFYWHFADRPALLAEMLDTWERTMVDDVIAEVDAGGGTGRERLLGLFRRAEAVPEAMPVELAIREWARREPAVLSRLRRIDNRRMEYMRRLFADFVDDAVEVEARCLLVFGLWIGQPLIAAEHGAHGRRRIVQTALEVVLR